MKRLTRQAPRSTRSSADAKPATALEFSSLSRPDFLAPIEQKSDYNNSSGKNTKNASSSSSGPGRQRAFDVEEAPTFRPSLEEFQDPLAYIDSIRTQAEPYGIIKVVPPQGWKPTFAIDTEQFRFTARIQQLNSLEGHCRIIQNFLDQLTKFHEQQGTPFNRIPIINQKPVDLLLLRKEVNKRGGYDKVTEMRDWADVGRIVTQTSSTSLSTLVRSIYQKLILPYENYIAQNEKRKLQRMAAVAGGGIVGSSTGGGVGQHYYRHQEASSPLSPRTPITNNLLNNNNNASPSPHPSASSPSPQSPPPPQHLNQQQPQLNHHNTNITRNSLSNRHLDGKETCQVCGELDDATSADDITMIFCEECELGHHLRCLSPPLTRAPDADWYCTDCLKASGNNFGFEDGKERSLTEFQRRGNRLKERYFRRMDEFEDDEEGRLILSELDVEREYWRLVENPFEGVEVEYGADLHSSHHGSGFPTAETHPLDPYSSCAWNLNNIPILPKSLFRNIRNDISGMMVPWLYVGMCFSTFCWHTEDHYTYSINYMHWGEPKTWYGIPADHADLFEQVMMRKFPELFEANPDLLFHLTTILSPRVLKEEGVKVYGVDQRENEFVITFPRVYHSGFNHGFNLAEAVNFALPNWLPFGLSCAQRYSEYKKMPVFSHDELIVTVATKDLGVENAFWLKAELEGLLERERIGYATLTSSHPNVEIMDQETEIPFDLSSTTESKLQCAFCNAFCFASTIECKFCMPGTIACFDHIDQVCKCQNREMLLTRRIGRKRIQGLIEECTIVAGKQLEWIQKYQETLATVETPSLVSLEYILKEGNRVPCKCPEIDSLRLFISRAKDWIDAVKRMLAKRVTPEHATYSSERSFENIIFLKAEGFRLCFDCPELSLLHTFCGELESFTQKTKELLTQASVAVVQMSQVPTILTQLNEMLLTGQEYTLTTAFPILSDISSKIKELEWVRRCYFCLECDNLDRASSLQILPDFETVLILLDEGRDSGARSDHPLVALLRRYKQSGDKWNLKAASLLKQKYISLPELNEILAEMVGVPVIAEYHVKLKNLLSMVIDWKDRVKNQFGFSLQKNEDEMEDVDDGRIRSSRATSGGGDASTEIALLGYKMVFSDTPILLNLHQDPTAPPPPHQPHLPITSFTPPSQPSPCSIEDVKKLIAELDEIPVSRVDEVVVLREWVKKVDDWSTKCKRVFMRGTAQRTLSELLKEVLLNVKTCCTEVANQEVIVEEEKGKYCICGFASQGFMIECDYCKEWYHGPCVGFRKKNASSQDAYVCLVCNVTSNPVVRLGKKITLPIIKSFLVDSFEVKKFLSEELSILEVIVAFVQDWQTKVHTTVDQLTQTTNLRNGAEGKIKALLRSMEGMCVFMEEEGVMMRRCVSDWYPVPEKKPLPPPPPSQSGKTIAKYPPAATTVAAVSEMSVELFCLCQAPHNESLPMIGCDKCECWYHFKCIKMDQNLADKIDTYECPVCSGAIAAPSWHPSATRSCKKKSSSLKSKKNIITTSQITTTNINNPQSKLTIKLTLPHKATTAASSTSSLSSSTKKMFSSSSSLSTLDSSKIDLHVSSSSSSLINSEDLLALPPPPPSVKNVTSPTLSATTIIPPLKGNISNSTKKHKPDKNHYISSSRMVNEGSSSSITAPATASSSSMKSSDVSQSSAAKSLPKEKKRPVGNGIAEGAVKKKKKKKAAPPAVLPPMYGMMSYPQFGDGSNPYSAFPHYGGNLYGGVGELPMSAPPFYPGFEFMMAAMQQQQQQQQHQQNQQPYQS